MASLSPIVGIDLGTTHSLVAVMREGQVEFIENELGDVLTPSVVAEDARTGALHVGRIAKDILVLEPQLAAATFKRTMGEERSYQVGRRKLGSVELSAHVVDALRFDAERTLGGMVNRCVITVPAYFNESQRFATKQAAELAGFSVERVLNEPTAAAIAFGLHELAEQKTFLVFDLGGGTFDVCVMELFEGMLEVKSVAGESQLGGEDFTAVLLELAVKRATGAALSIDDLAGEPRAQMLKRAELLKRQLSRWSSAEINVPAGVGDLREPAPIAISAEEAERAYAPLLDRLRGPCRAALRGAGIRPDDLDEVVLVGGATRMPVIKRFVEELFGRAPRDDIDPDLVVARGAAIQAALCADDDAVGDMVVTDVASHSMGVDTTRSIGARYVGGYFSPIIHRNTVIPTSCSETYATLEPNQTEIVFTVYEGESRRVTDNTRIGTLAVKGIPRGPAGQAVDVRFTYDLNGMLEVEATVIKTGVKCSKIFKRNGGKIGRVELEKAANRLRAIKADPLERPRYRDLHGRAQLLWQEVTPEVRQTLGHAIDLFEAAVSARDVAEIEQAYSLLLSVCEQIDGGERW